MTSLLSAKKRAEEFAAAVDGGADRVRPAPRARRAGRRGRHPAARGASRRAPGPSPRVHRHAARAADGRGRRPRSPRTTSSTLPDPPQGHPRAAARAGRLRARAGRRHRRHGRRGAERPARRGALPDQAWPRERPGRPRHRPGRQGPGPARRRPTAAWSRSRGCFDELDGPQPGRRPPSTTSPRRPSRRSDLLLDAFAETRRPGRSSTTLRAFAADNLAAAPGAREDRAGRAPGRARRWPPTRCMRIDAAGRRRPARRAPTAWTASKMPHAVPHRRRGAAGHGRPSHRVRLNNDHPVITDDTQPTPDDGDGTRRPATATADGTGDGEPTTDGTGRHRRRRAARAIRRHRPRRRRRRPPATSPATARRQATGDGAKDAGDKVDGRAARATLDGAVGDAAARGPSDPLGDGRDSRRLGVRRRQWKTDLRRISSE